MASLSPFLALQQRAWSALFSTSKRLILPLALSISLATPADAQKKVATKEFCLVSPSAVDVESTKRTAGSVSLLGGVIGGASVDRDVTERRTTNISDDSLKTKREQYAIQCNYEIKNAKNDEERIAIANRLFAEWFPELGPRRSQPANTFDNNPLFNPDFKGDERPNSARQPADIHIDNNPLFNPDFNGNGHPNSTRQPEPDSIGFEKLFSTKCDGQCKSDQNFIAMSDRNRIMFDLAEYAQAQVPADIASVSQFKYTCQVVSDKIFVSIRGLGKGVYDRRKPYPYEKELIKKGEMVDTGTLFYAVTAIISDKSVVFKNLAQNFWFPSQPGWAYSYKTDAGSFEAMGGECVVLLFRNAKQEAI